MIALTPARRHIISGLFVNLAAAWFAAVALTPSLISPDDTASILLLTYDIIGGIVFVTLAVIVEEKL